MPYLNFLLSWTPILLIFVLAVFFRTGALRLSLWAFLYTLILATFVFETDLQVILLAAVDGVLTTTPLLLVVYAGILLSLFLIEKGSLQRLAAWLDAGGKLNSVRHSLLLSFGIGNFLEGAGIIAEPVAAPMIRASGVKPTASAVLSVLGYSGVMHLSLAGVIFAVLATVTGLPPQVLARDLGILSFVATFLFAFCVPWILGVAYGFRMNIVPLFVTALLTASVTLIAARFVATSIAGMFGGIAVVVFFFVMVRHLPKRVPGLMRDIAPFAFIVACLASVNLIPSLRHLCRNEWVVTVRLIPGHTISLRPFFDAYLYLFLAFLLAYRLHASTNDSLKTLLLKSTSKASKAVLAMALFGAMGQVIAYTGYGDAFARFDPGKNIALCLAQGLIDLTGNLYPLFAPVLGWIGTFLTGYGVASIMLFGNLHLQTAEMMGISSSLLVSSMTVGASIGSISSPFKIAIAAPLCGAEGKEGEILRKTIPLGIAVSLATGLFTLLLARL